MAVQYRKVDDANYRRKTNLFQPCHGTCRMGGRSGAVLYSPHCANVAVAHLLKEVNEVWNKRMTEQDGA